MAEYTFCDVTVVRREYELRTPTTWTEVYKVLAALERELEEEHVDDRVTVETLDDRILFWYERSRKINRD